MCEHSNTGGSEKEKDRRLSNLSGYYSSISFSEYLVKLEDNPLISESSPQRLLRIIKSGGIKSSSSEGGLPELPPMEYRFFRQGKYKVEGLREVLHSLVRGIDIASSLIQKDRILPIIMVGPTGSGKTLLQKGMSNGLEHDWEDNIRYTFKLGGDPCPTNENPINLLTTSLMPRKVREEYVRYNGSELCPVCMDKYKDLLSTHYDSSKPLAEVLDEFVEVIPFRPTYSIIELSHEDFPEIFERAVKRCNRGILHIEIDDKDISETPSINYQIILKLRDRIVSLEDGSLFKPDIIVFLYGDENILKELHDNTPLGDSIHPVLVRRNLSYMAEERIYKDQNLPFEHVSPHSLELLSKYVIGTRTGNATESGVRSAIELYNKFEEGQPLNSDEVDSIKKNLLDADEPNGGWGKGISSRQLISQLLSISSMRSECLTLECVREYLEEQKNTSPRDIVKGLLKDVSFGELMLGYTAVTMNGAVQEVEDEFTYYVELFRDKRLNNRQKVNVLGEGEVPINRVMTSIRDKLNVTTNIDKLIEQHYEEHGSPPSFIDIVTENPDIMTENEAVKEFIPWEEFRRGVELSPHHRDRVDRIISSLKELGYCKICGENLIKIGSEEIDS